MGKAAIVFWSTESEVLNQVLTGLRIKTVKVLRSKRAQQQLRLIEPPGMCGRVEHSQVWPAREVAVGLMRDMGAAIVHDQMNASSFGIAPFDLAHAP